MSGFRRKRSSSTHHYSSLKITEPLQIGGLRQRLELRKSPPDLRNMFVGPMSERS